MSAPNDGGPAFPIPPVGTGDPRDGMSCGSQGMTLRDYFAALETLIDWDQPNAIMPSDTADQLAGRPRPSDGNYLNVLKWEADWRAAIKYIRADAMLAAREKGVQ